MESRTKAAAHASATKPTAPALKARPDPKAPQLRNHSAGEISRGIKPYRDLGIRPRAVLIAIAEDPRWAPARGRSEFTELQEAAGLAAIVLGKLAAGLEIANVEEIHPSQMEKLQDYVKTAKAVSTRLRDLCLPVNSESVPRLRKLPRTMNQRSAVKDCVPAWKEVLRVIRANSKATNTLTVEKMVNLVIADKPELGPRLRFEKAKENTARTRKNLFEAIGKGLIGRKVPREVPFELAAFACGLPSAEAARHLFYPAPKKRKRP